MACSSVVAASGIHIKLTSIWEGCYAWRLAGCSIYVAMLLLLLLSFWKCYPFTFCCYASICITCMAHVVLGDTFSSVFVVFISVFFSRDPPNPIDKELFFLSLSLALCLKQYLHASAAVNWILLLLPLSCMHVLLLTARKKTEDSTFVCTCCFFIFFVFCLMTSFFSDSVASFFQLLALGFVGHILRLNSFVWRISSYNT